MRTTAVWMLLFLALAGCSTKAERTDYMKDAGKGRPLDMPPDLVVPKTDGKYVVPEGSAETSATYSDYARGGASQNQSCTCKEAALVPQSGVPASAVAAAPQLPPPQLLARADGSQGILISEPFDRSWLKVSVALDRARIAVEDKDRSKGLFYLKGGHQLSVQARAAETGKPETCEVMAANGSGAPDDESKRIIAALYKALAK